LDRSNFISRDHARIQVFDFIEGFYNLRRRHSALGYLSPERYETTTSMRIDNDQGAPAAA
jgi:transposase InsO family protein